MKHIVLLGSAFATIITNAGVDFGNALVARDYASDFPVGLGNPAPVLVLPAAVLPEGILNSFKTYNQVEPGGSPFASAGNTFTAYILRPTGVPHQFTEVYSSGLLTVPTVSASGIQEFGVSPFHTLPGDRIAYYGQGVPVSIDLAGTDTLVYPANNAPMLNATFTVGASDFPVYPQNRFYSFAANVTPVPEASTYLAGIGALAIMGLSAWNIRGRRHSI